MAARSKQGATRVQHVPGPPKKTRQGQGQHSKPKGNKKKLRGQGH